MLHTELRTTQDHYQYKNAVCYVQNDVTVVFSVQLFSLIDCAASGCEHSIYCLMQSYLLIHFEIVLYEQNYLETV